MWKIECKSYLVKSVCLPNMAPHTVLLVHITQSRAFSKSINDSQRWPDINPDQSFDLMGTFLSNREMTLRFRKSGVTRAIDRNICARGSYLSNSNIDNENLMSLYNVDYANRDILTNFSMIAKNMLSIKCLAKFSLKFACQF